jgi:hypothetical protein
MVMMVIIWIMLRMLKYEDVFASSFLVDKSTKIQDRVDVSAPKLSTIKYLECENHVSEEFFLW